MHRAHIKYLKVQNFRALRDIEFKDLTPLTVLVGPNGCGKSTVLDVFAFLAECFELGLRHAWDKRGRAKELKTRGSDGPVTIEIKYKELTYHLAIDEKLRGPVVVEEWLQQRGSTFRFLEYREGQGRVPLKSADLLAVNVFGQFARYPRVAALRDFIIGWSANNNGDNLANVIQYLAEQHKDRLERIFEALRRRVPRIERVLAEIMPDGRLLLQIKDAPFRDPMLAKFASDGTLKMLAYLVLLYDPLPPPFIGIEEPENFLHPRLLPELAEEFRAASTRTQLLVTTHSPFFLNGLRPTEVRMLWRDEQGYTCSRCIEELNSYYM